MFVQLNQQGTSAEVLAIQSVAQQPSAPPPLTYQPESDPLADEDLSLAAEQVMGDYLNFDEEYEGAREKSISPEKVFTH
jgi:hypothetical protein